jgi:hypothetical protein
VNAGASAVECVVGLTRMLTLSELDTRLIALQRTMADEDAKLIAALLQITAAWRTNPEPPASLTESLTKLHGNVWFSTNEASSAVYDVLVQYRKTVDSLGGMTGDVPLRVDHRSGGRWV